MPGRCRLPARKSGLAQIAGALLIVIAGGAACSGSASHKLRSVVAGVTFVSASAHVRDECHRTANSVGYPVPCPTLLPVGLTPTPPVPGCHFAVIAASGQRGLCVSRGWIFGSSQTVDPQTGALTEHLVIQGAPRIFRNPAWAIDGPVMMQYPSIHTRTEPEGVVRIAGRLMRFYLVPSEQIGGDAFRGHLVLVWDAYGHTYAYGFHVLETLPVARALDLELVRHLVTVYPKRR